MVEIILMEIDRRSRKQKDIFADGQRQTQANQDRTGIKGQGLFGIEKGHYVDGYLCQRRIGSA